jgi:hypothetical protein
MATDVRTALRSSGLKSDSGASMNFMRPHSVIVRLFDGNEFQCPKSQTEKNISEKQLMLNNFRVAGI